VVKSMSPTSISPLSLHDALPISFEQEPEYLITGGLVFQPLTKNFLRSWGQDWERRAPFRLAYFRNQDPTPERPAIVILSQVMPRSEEHTSELQSRGHLVCRLLLE